MDFAPIPSFPLVGVCSEVRDLKTKDGRVFQHLVKFSCMGGTFELATRDQKLADSCQVGAQYECTGNFEQFNNTWKFMLTNAKRIVSK